MFGKNNEKCLYRIGIKAIRVSSYQASGLTLRKAVVVLQLYCSDSASALSLALTLENGFQADSGQSVNAAADAEAQCEYILRDIEIPAGKQS